LTEKKFKEILFSNKLKPFEYNGLSIFEDTAVKALYFGTNGGLQIKIGETQNERIPQFVNNDKGIVLNMTKNRRGQLWYCTGKNGGIFDYDKTTYIPNEISGMKGAMCIYCDYNDNLWFGGQKGLFFYDYKQFYQIPHPELNSMIGSICETDSTHFVYDGVRGIGILDLEKFYSDLPKHLQGFQNIEGVISYFDKSYGFMGEEVGQNAMMRDSKGRIWVATNTNVIRLDPKELTANTFAPFTHVSLVQISEDNVTWQPLPDGVTQIGRTFKNLHIEFIGINHKAPERVRYSYILEGNDTEWTALSAVRTVSYTNLVPGVFTFKLKAVNGAGVWSNVIERRIEIVPAVWQRTWFKVTVIVFIVLIIIILTSFVVVKISHFRMSQRETSLTVKHLRLANLRSQIYPHFFFNSLSAIASAFYHQDRETAYKFFLRLSDQIRESLKDSNRTYKSLADEMRFVENYLAIQKFRFGDRLNYHIDIQNIEQDELSGILVPPMLIQTFVENSVKHGIEPMKTGGEVLLKLKKSAQSIEIEIDDNGIGLSASAVHSEKSTGIGLKNLNEAITLYNNEHIHKISFQFKEKLAPEQGVHAQIVLNGACKI